jgi:hypothetical protein
LDLLEATTKTFRFISKKHDQPTLENRLSQQYSRVVAIVAVLKQRSPHPVVTTTVHIWILECDFPSEV